MAEMNLKNHDTLSHDGYIVYRRPLLSLGFLDAWLETYHNAADVGNSHDAINSLLENEDISSAIRINNPALYARLRDATSHEKASSDFLVLLRYLVRMSTRATPFAAYAAVGVGNIGAQFCSELDGSVGCDLDIDCGVLLELDRKLKSEVARDDRMRVRLPNIIYRKGEVIQFVEQRLENKRLNYELSRTDRSEFIDLTMSRLSHPRRIGELAEELVELDSSVTRDEVVDFLYRLLDAGFIQIDADLELTGGNRLGKYLESIASAVPQATSTRPFELLKSVHTLLMPGTRHRLPAAAPRVERAEGLLAEYGYTFPSGHVVHADSFCDSDLVGVDGRTLAKLYDVIATMRYLLPKQEDNSWRELVSKFEDRFGTEFVPLVVALDPDCGIALDQSQQSIRWMDGVRILPKSVSKPNDEHVYQALLNTCIRSSQNSIDLHDVFPHPSGVPSPLPGSFSACLTVYQEGTESPSMAVNFLHGPGATNLNARFAARDPKLAKAVRGTAAREDNASDETVYAEVIYLPSPRHANVSTRPASRDYEIVLSGGSSVPRERQIRPDELSIGVVAGEIVLWSTRLNKRVVPRFSSAYNYRHRGNLGIYQFLCRLAANSPQLPNFRWPGSMWRVPSLPRVMCGDVLISRARWHWNKAKILDVCAHIEKKNWSELEAIFDESAMPRWFSVEAGDNLLEIDRRNFLALTLLRDEIRSLEEVVLTESPARIGKPVLSRADGHWHSEIIVPLHKSRALAKQDDEFSKYSRFVLGNAVLDLAPAPKHEHAWHFVKIYASEDYLESLLVSHIEPLLRQAVDNGIVKCWFFVRYYDPDFHLRLRLQGGGDAFAMLLRHLHDDLLGTRYERQEIAAYRTDHYLPEYSRYGGRHLMPLVERIFHGDSTFSGKMLRAARRTDSSDIIWKAALCGALDYMRMCGLSHSAVNDMVQFQRKAFGNEMELGKSEFDGLGKVYRKHRKYIESVVASSEMPDDIIGNALRDRAESVQPLLEALCSSAASSAIVHLLPSIIHMQANRLFTGISRPQEFVIWDFLARAQRSVAARSKSEVSEPHGDIHEEC